TIVNRTVTPRRRPNTQLRPREYLTPKEVEALQDAARKRGRHGHRDATAILITYRHGLRASELCELTWDMIELDRGRIHVRRAKHGVDSTHPLTGKEIRALSPATPRQPAQPLRLQHRAQWPGDESLVLEDDPQDRGTGQAAVRRASAHVAPRLRLQARQRRRRHPSAAALYGPSQHHTHGALHRAAQRPLQPLLEGLRAPQ